MSLLRIRRAKTKDTLRLQQLEPQIWGEDRNPQWDMKTFIRFGLVLIAEDDLESDLESIHEDLESIHGGLITVFTESNEIRGWTCSLKNHIELKKGL